MEKAKENTSLVVCPICDTPATKSRFIHRTIGEQLFACESCSYHFVDCSKMTSEMIYGHQNSNSDKFGHNLRRNLEYLDFLSQIKNNSSVTSLLEIGTPSNHDFLKRVYHRFGDQIVLYSHDLLETDLPEYVHFYLNRQDLYDKNIDILFCIHTLEHIPTNELLEFVGFCKGVSKHFVFEVPHCATSERILQSTVNPHYSFFSEASIRALFGDDVETQIHNKVLKFNNLSF